VASCDYYISVTTNEATTPIYIRVAMIILLAISKTATHKPMLMVGLL
jgi:hypothetical protein